jgi:hypothetical protein
MYVVSKNETKTTLNYETILTPLVIYCWTLSFQEAFFVSTLLGLPESAPAGQSTHHRVSRFQRPCDTADY